MNSLQNFDALGIRQWKLVTLALQKENTDSSDIRFLFDEILKDFPGLAPHCGTVSNCAQQGFRKLKKF